MTARESAVAEALESHRVHDRRSDPRFPWCICGWEPESGGSGNQRIYYAHQAHVAAAVLAALDTTPQPLTLATVEAAVRRWVPASEALVEKVMAELAGAVVESQPALGDDERAVNVALSVWSNTCNALCDEQDRVHAPECRLAAGLYNTLAARAHQPTPPAQAEAVAAVERVRALADEWQAVWDEGKAMCDEYGNRDGVSRMLFADRAAASLRDALAPTATAPDQ